MAKWMGAWLSYYRRMWAVGVLAAFMAVVSFAVSVLLLWLPVTGLAWLIGWDIGDTDAVIFSALIGMPVALGIGIEVIARDGSLFPKRPPEWWAYKLGVSLPKYED